MLSTMGAPQKWVTPSDWMRSRTARGSTWRRQMLVAPMAGRAQVKHHPLQWNMGSVHRYTESRVSPFWRQSLMAFSSAPRWVYITPLGRPVVPLV